MTLTTSGLKPQSLLIKRVVYRLREEVPDEVVKLYPDIFETFVAAAPHVYIRFGMWDDITNLEQPDDKKLYVTTNALPYYAKAVAYANLGNHKEAKKCAEQFVNASALVPESRHLFNNKSRDILEIANEMMLGEVAFKSGNKTEGLNHLRQAVELDDNLNYEESGLGHSRQEMLWALCF